MTNEAKEGSSEIDRSMELADPELEHAGVALTDYEKYRGKCKEISEALVLENPTLILIRGRYHCPFWGEQAHWWCKKSDGTIVDPTKDQFPSKGAGEYVEFNGMVQCSECGKEMKEEEASYVNNYCFCSYECHGRFVGVF
jgi:hypothetical protein